MTKNLQDILQSIQPLDAQAMQEANLLQQNFIKPLGSLGELEEISIRLAGITGRAKNSIEKKVICLFGSDHGIYNEGVCSSPQEFTKKLMQVYAAQQNAAINILARQAEADLKIYDLGVKDLKPQKNIITHKFLENGTENFLNARAMTSELTQEVIEFGISLVKNFKAQGVGLIATGEVGMGNTTPACACIMAALKSRDKSLIGRGAGLSDEGLENKQRVILKALDFHKNNLTDPVNILSCVGGLDLAAMTGIFIGGARYRVPVIIDGVISIASALIAYLLSPMTKNFFFASHESLEPAYNFAAKFMGLTPCLKLSMRLGEGTGAAIFMQIISDALAIINNMGNFDEL